MRNLGGIRRAYKGVAGAEGALAGARKERAADLRIGGDPAPRVRELAERRRVERVRLRRAVDGDYGNMWMIVGKRQVRGHVVRKHALRAGVNDVV